MLVTFAYVFIVGATYLSRGFWLRAIRDGKRPDLAHRLESSRFDRLWFFLVGPALVGGLIVAGAWAIYLTCPTR